MHTCGVYGLPVRLEHVPLIWEGKKKKRPTSLDLNTKLPRPNISWKTNLSSAEKQTTFDDPLMNKKNTVIVFFVKDLEREVERPEPSDPGLCSRRTW